MKLPNLKLTLLSVTCLSGLVSCFPLDPARPTVPGVYMVPGSMTPEQQQAALAQQQAEANGSFAAPLTPEALATHEREMLEAERTEAMEVKPTEIKKPFVEKPAPIEKPIVKPVTVKTAASVKDKPGFVYNPYTQNQVDVRGIPSGTKVRDPHDSNPAHVFKVP